MNLSIVIKLYRSALCSVIHAVAVSIGFLWISLLAGCIHLSLPDKRPSEFPEETAVEPLIGRGWTEVVEKLGPPTYTSYRNGISYYLYETLIRDKAILGIAPLISEQCEAYCLLLEFGGDNLLRRYQFKVKEFPWENTKDASSEIDTQNCLDVIDVADAPYSLLHLPHFAYPAEWSTDWPLSRLGAIGPLSETLKKTMEHAEKGDAEAQFQLYLANSIFDPIRWVWLCRAADQGHTHAQAELGRAYKLGLAPGGQDVTHAYMWYSLAAQSASGGSYEWKRLAVRMLMTADQIAEAERMLADWKPGQCERDLDVTNVGY